MFKITIIGVGKTKDARLQELVDEFYDRLRSSATISQVIVKDEANLWAKIPKQCQVIALEVDGKVMDSPSLAKYIQNAQVQGISHLAIIIGPAEGFTGYQASVAMKLSLSAMTFSHQTIRLLLAEQLYRAFTIIEGKPFAK